jgi:hypothetical protein
MARYSFVTKEKESSFPAKPIRRALDRLPKLWRINHARYSGWKKCTICGADVIAMLNHGFG